MVRHVAIWIGVAIFVIAVLDMLDITIEFPTQNTTANLAIGAGLAGAAFYYPKIHKA